MNSQRPNSGILFKNSRKNTEKHPDYTGSANVEGVDYELAAWIKEGRKGKFMSLAIKPARSQEAESDNAPTENTPAPNADASDEIPF